MTGVHGVMEAQDGRGFQTILNGAFLCTPDGMPMVWMGKLNGQARDPPGVWTGFDAGGLRVERDHWLPTFFLGGAAGVAELLAPN